MNNIKSFYIGFFIIINVNFNNFLTVECSKIISSSETQERIKVFEEDFLEKIDMLCKEVNIIFDENEIKEALNKNQEKIQKIYYEILDLPNFQEQPEELPFLTDIKKNFSNIMKKYIHNSLVCIHNEIFTLGKDQFLQIKNEIENAVCGSIIHDNDNDNLKEFFVTYRQVITQNLPDNLPLHFNEVFKSEDFDKYDNNDFNRLNESIQNSLRLEIFPFYNNNKIKSPDDFKNLQNLNFLTFLFYRPYPLDLDYCIRNEGRKDYDIKSESYKLTTCLPYQINYSERDIHNIDSIIDSLKTEKLLEEIEKYNDIIENINTKKKEIKDQYTKYYNKQIAENTCNDNIKSLKEQITQLKRLDIFIRIQNFEKMINLRNHINYQYKRRNELFYFDSNVIKNSEQQINQLSQKLLSTEIEIFIDKITNAVKKQWNYFNNVSAKNLLRYVFAHSFDQCLLFKNNDHKLYFFILTFVHKLKQEIQINQKKQLNNSKTNEILQKVCHYLFIIANIINKKNSSFSITEKYIEQHAERKQRLELIMLSIFEKGNYRQIMLNITTQFKDFINNKIDEIDCENTNKDILNKQLKLIYNIVLKNYKKIMNNIINHFILNVENKFLEDSIILIEDVKKIIKKELFISHVFEISNYIYLVSGPFNNLVKKIKKNKELNFEDYHKNIYMLENLYLGIESNKENIETKLLNFKQKDFIKLSNPFSLTHPRNIFLYDEVDRVYKETIQYIINCSECWSDSHGHDNIQQTQEQKKNEIIEIVKNNNQLNKEITQLEEILHDLLNNFDESKLLEQITTINNILQEFLKHQDINSNDDLAIEIQDCMLQEKMMKNKKKREEKIQNINDLIVTLKTSYENNQIK